LTGLFLGGLGSSRDNFATAYSTKRGKTTSSSPIPSREYLFLSEKILIPSDLGPYRLWTSDIAENRKPERHCQGTKERANRSSRISSKHGRTYFFARAFGNHFHSLSFSPDSLGWQMKMIMPELNF